jgi:hypothetical protein
VRRDRSVGTSAGLSCCPLSAVRAVSEDFFKCSSALPAYYHLFLRRSGLTLGEIIPFGSASIADENRLSLFYSEYGNKKKTQIMIHTLQISLHKTAGRASSRCTLKSFNFWGNACDQKHCSIIVISDSGIIFPAPEDGNKYLPDKKTL